MTTSINYRLPTSELVVAGTVITQTDTLGTKGQQTTQTLASVEFAIVTSADALPALTLEPPTGWFKTYKGSFSQLPDGRLSSASSDVTGEVGTVLKSVASIAGTVVAAVALAEAAEPRDDLDIASITDAYKGTYPDSSKLLNGLRKARARVHAALVEKLCSDNPDPDNVRRLRTQLSQLDEQLIPAVAHFRTWRKSRVKTVEERFEFRQGVGSLPTDAPKAFTEQKKGGVPQDLESLWNPHGYGVQARWIDYAEGKRTDETKAVSSDTDTVHTRRPQRLELVLYRHVDGQALPTARSRHLVADNASEVVDYKLEKSWFGRRSLALTFDANGFVTTVANEGNSAAANALTALAGLPEGFAGGVEGATKAYNSVQAAGRATIEAEATRLKADVARREQRLLAAGLDATAADVVELKRLEQLQSILELQTKIQGTDPRLVTDLASRAGGDLAWYQIPVATPAEPPALRVILSGDGAQRGDVDEGHRQPPPALG
jgi:hypothetical protein